jgi:Sulfotransferase family
MMLNETTVLDTVRKETGQKNVFETGLGDRLQRILKHIDQDLGLDDAGKQLGARSVIELLKSRTLVLADQERYPEIKREVITRPFIVTGMPRSGTTVMQYLMGADPASRSPLYWETVWPSPPPGLNSQIAKRIALGDEEVGDFCRRNPFVLQAHHYWGQGARAIVECEMFGTLDLRNVNPTSFFRIPAVLQVFLNDDPLGYYQFHKKALQNLQWKMPQRRWALKGTEHHAYMDSLRKVYPGAIVIWIHRDPYKVVPSVMQLFYQWFTNITGQTLPRATFGRQVMGMFKAMLDKAMLIPEANHPDINNVLFADFMADPVAEIKKIYDRNGIPFPAAARDAMKAWLADPANASDRYGKFQYSLDDFEMTREEVDAAFSAYRYRFGIPQEK